MHYFTTNLNNLNLRINTLDEKPAPSHVDIFSDPLQSLSMGWSMFTSNAPQLFEALNTTMTKGAEIATSAVSKGTEMATKGAEIALNGAETFGQHLTETVIKPTSNALRDPNLTTNIQNNLSLLQQSVSYNIHFDRYIYILT